MNPTLNNTAPANWVAPHWEDGYAPPGYPPAQPRWVEGHWSEGYQPPQLPQNPQYGASRAAYQHPGIGQAYGDQAQASSSSAAAAVGHPIPEDTSYRSLVNNTNLPPTYKRALISLGKWLENQSQNLYANVLTSGLTVENNSYIATWLNLRRTENPYGNNGGKTNHCGKSAVIAFLKYYGKPY
jgi:hypothetical protein